MDILVTTPKKEMENAAKEAAEVVEAGAGTYFRYLGMYKPNNTKEGDRIYYTENGFITGFCIINEFKRRFNQRCGTTGRNWPNGWYVYMDATTWQWIKPIPYKGFQGWRYFNNELYGPKLEIVGDYKIPKPINK
jgi:hypothetical protein